MVFQVPVLVLLVFHVLAKDAQPHERLLVLFTAQLLILLQALLALSRHELTLFTAGLHLAL